MDLTTSESEKQYYQRLELQERMGATISSFFPNIKDAKVTIAFGEDRKYVLDSENASKATASIAVTTKDGSDISTDDVKAMQRLVSRSIPQLEFEIAISNLIRNSYQALKDKSDPEIRISTKQFEILGL